MEGNRRGEVQELQKSVLLRYRMAPEYQPGLDMKTETSEHFAEDLCTNTLTVLWKKEQGKGGAHQ